MANYDPIDEALNTSSTAIEVSTTPEGGCLRRKDQLEDVLHIVVIIASPAGRTVNNSIPT